MKDIYCQGGTSPPGRGLLVHKRVTPLEEGTAQAGDRQADQQLVERVQQGDKRAFDLLVIKYQHRVVKLVMRYVGDRDEAQDIAQDAFIKAYRALPGFRGESAFYTWLYRIAINTAKNWLVTQGRRPNNIDIDELEELGGAAELRDLATPETQFQRNEVQQAVVAAFEALTEDLRQAIVLRELQGLSYEEIAEQLQCPIGTVRSRIFRARESINKALEPYV